MVEDISSDNPLGSSPAQRKIISKVTHLKSPDDEQEESVRFNIYSPKLESIYAQYSSRNES